MVQASSHILWLMSAYRQRNLNSLIEHQQFCSNLNRRHHFSTVMTTNDWPTDANQLCKLFSEEGHAVYDQTLAGTQDNPYLEYD